jgi:outer membrane protein, heavy metal efflux system
MMRIFSFTGQRLALAGFALLALQCNTSVSAADEPAPATLVELEQLALEHNPSIKAQYREWRASLSDVAVARALPDPQFSYTEFIEEVQTRVGPQRRKFTLGQMFPWPGTLGLRENMAMAKAGMAEQKLRQLQNGVVNELRQTLFDLQLVERKLNIHREHLVILGDLEKSQQGGLQSGRGDLATVLRIQVECEKMHNDIASLEAFRKPLNQKLEKILGVKIHQSLPSLSLDGSELPSPAELEKLYLKNHPLWLAQQKNITMAEQSLALAEKKNYPDIGLGLGWIDTGPALMPNTVGSGDDPFTVTLSLSIPLWRSKVRSGVDAAQDRLLANEAGQQMLIDEFRSTLEMAMFKVRDSKRRVDLYRAELLPKANDAFASSRTSNEAGRASFMMLLDAERMVLQFALDSQVAEIEMAKAKAELEYIVGSPLLHLNTKD